MDVQSTAIRVFDLLSENIAPTAGLCTQKRLSHN